MNGCVCVLFSPGEEWQVSKVGAYLPGVHEEVLDIVNAFILTDKVIHLSAPVVAELQHVLWAQIILG